MGLSHSPRIVTDGLVLCLDAANKRSYPGAGTAWTDLTANKNNGTLTNMTDNFSTDGAGSLTFDGTDEYIATPFTGTFSAISFEFWGFFDDPTLNMTSRKESAFGDWQASRVHFGTRWSAGSVGMHFNVNGVYQTTSPTNLKYGWNHYLLVYDTGANAKKVYLNNKLSSSHGTNGTMTIGDFRIGVATNLNQYYRGSISNFKIYNVGLTANEVQQNYLATKGRYA